MTDYPVVKPIGDSVWIVWPGWTVEFSRVYDHRESLSAEVSIVDETLGALHIARLNLLSTQAKSGLARTLDEACPTRPWKDLLEQSCRRVLKHLRHQGEGQYMVPQASAGQQWLVADRVRRGDITILYGDGGTGKSLFALAFAVFGLLGHDFGFWKIAPFERVLYLDWETDIDAHQERLHGLTRGLEHIPSESIYYRRLFRPVAEDISSLRADADRHQADLVICDSLGAACGSEPETPGAAVEALMAVRSLRGTKLVIAHVNKVTAEGGQGAKPFGSVYVHNLARSTFFAKASDDEGDRDELTVTLHHRKNNYGRKTKPTGFRFGFNINGIISVGGATADLSAATIPALILAELRAGQQTARAIAEKIGKDEHTVRSRLGELKTARKVVEISAVSGGRGHKSLWGLAFTNRTGDAK